MSVEKWWNEICGRGKREKPRVKPTQTLFRPPRNHMEGPRCELGTPAVGGERLTACATRPPQVIGYGPILEFILKWAHIQELELVSAWGDIKQWVGYIKACLSVI